MKRRLFPLSPILASFLFISCSDDPSDTTDLGDQWIWHQVEPGPALHAIADDGQSFAAVGESRFQTSVDGRTWSVEGADGELWDVVPITQGWVSVGDSGRVIMKAPDFSGAIQVPGFPDLFGVAASDSLVVVVGEEGFIASSPDWDDLTPRESSTEATLTDVHWNGEVFVAVGTGGAMVVSPDGVTWSLVSSATGNDLTAVTEGRFGTWIAVGPQGTVVRSQRGDAGLWEGGIESGVLSFHDVVWTGTRFVAVGPDGYIGESPDGKTWFSESSNTTQDLERLIVSHDRLLAVGSGPTILMSETAGDWKEVNPGSHFHALRGLWTGSRFVVLGPGILTSIDGSAWVESYSDPDVRLYGVARSPAYHVAVGTEDGAEGLMLGSADGVHWSPIATAPTDKLYLDVAWGDAGFLVVSTALEGDLSPDGQDWERIALPAAFYRVIWGNETYLALGQHAIGLSENGIDWEFESYPFGLENGAPSDVEWVDGLFVMAGPGDRISTSANGRNWDVHVTGSGANIVAVTQKGPWTYAAGEFGTILVSSDLDSWAEQASGTTHLLWDIVAGSRSVLAVGGSGTILTLE